MKMTTTSSRLETVHFGTEMCRIANSNHDLDMKDIDTNHDDIYTNKNNRNDNNNKNYTVIKILILRILIIA